MARVLSPTERKLLEAAAAHGPGWTHAALARISGVSLRTTQKRVRWLVLSGAWPHGEPRLGRRPANADQPLPRDRVALVEAHVAIARARARWIARRRPDLAMEAESEVLWTLVLAARDYEPDRGIPFAHFLASRLRSSFQRTVLALRFGTARGTLTGSGPARRPLDFEPAARTLSPLDQAIYNEELARSITTRKRAS